MDHFPQRRRADGGCQRCTDKILLASSGRRKGARLQNGQKTLFRYGDSLCACIVSKLDVHSFSHSFAGARLCAAPAYYKGIKYIIFSIAQINFLCL